MKKIYVTLFITFITQAILFSMSEEYGQSRILNSLLFTKIAQNHSLSDKDYITLDINYQDPQHQNSFFHIAAEKNNFKVIKELVNRYSSQPQKLLQILLLKNKHGKTALDIISDKTHDISSSARKLIFSQQYNYIRNIIEILQYQILKNDIIQSLETLKEKLQPLILAKNKDSEFHNAIKTIQEQKNNLVKLYDEVEQELKNHQLTERTLEEKLNFSSF